MANEPLTDERLAEIRARCEAATPGPWGVWTSMDNTRDILSEAVHPVLPLAGLYGESGHPDNPSAQEDANAAFIAAARGDVPDLLAEIERLTADIDRVSRENDALRRVIEEALPDRKVW